MPTLFGLIALWRDSDSLGGSLSTAIGRTIILFFIAALICIAANFLTITALKNLFPTDRMA